MKLAVVAITKAGRETGRRITNVLLKDEVTLFLPEKWAYEGAVAYGGALKDLIPKLWAEYQGIIFVMAAGIVVRMIAPFIQSKQVDPAVVVVDEQGRHAISLLSGHWGGANALTQRVAQGIGANPVITTATDVEGRLAFDVLAKDYGLAVRPFEHIKIANSAMVNGEEILLYTDYAFPFQWPDNVRTATWEEIIQAEGVPKVYITNRQVPEGPATLVLSPRSVYVGIGCRRGVSPETVILAIEAGLREAGRDLRAVKGLGSVDIKKDEAGLIEAAGRLQIPLSFFTQEELVEVQGCSFSSFVFEQIGVGSVCEPAVMRMGQDVALILPKRIYSGVTVAVGEEKSLPSASDPVT